MPAKAGIQGWIGAQLAVMDSRPTLSRGQAFRGNDKTNVAGLFNGFQLRPTQAVKSGQP